jgi:hypothetical protein
MVKEGKEINEKNQCSYYCGWYYRFSGMKHQKCLFNSYSQDVNLIHDDNSTGVAWPGLVIIMEVFSIIPRLLAILKNFRVQSPRNRRAAY